MDNKQENRQENYRGFDIAVTAWLDHDDLWDFDYRISKDAGGGAAGNLQVAAQERTKGKYATPETACDAGIEIAKIEIDNRIALTEK